MCIYVYSFMIFLYFYGYLFAFLVNESFSSEVYSESEELASYWAMSDKKLKHGP